MIYKILAPFRFVIFWIVAVLQIPIVALIPVGKMSVAYSRVFYSILMWIAGVHCKKCGEKLSANRPLMLVSNHISIFELAVFPILGLGSFFGKSEIAKYPLVGWFAKKFGVIFIDRNPRRAATEVAKINRVMKSSKYPMTIFPEGTTNNGCFIYPFKSSMFDVVDKIDGLTIQPIVLLYRDKCGCKITDDNFMANNYSCPSLAKIRAHNDASGANEIVPEREFSTMGHFYHIMKMGGVTLELNLLPPVDLTGLDRKEIAQKLHKIINEKYMELK